jgi:hypothetical protein
MNVVNTTTRLSNSFITPIPFFVEKLPEQVETFHRKRATEFQTVRIQGKPNKTKELRAHSAFPILTYQPTITTSPG